MFYGLLKRRSALAQRLSVGRTLAFKTLALCRHGPFTHCRMADNQARSAGFVLGVQQRHTDSVRVIAGYLLHKPAPGLILSRYILARHVFAMGG